MASRNSQPLIDQYNFQPTFGGGGTVNLPITITQQGAIVIVLSKFDGNGTPTVSFNGNAMTLLVAQTSASASAHIFAYTNPPVGNFNVTFVPPGIGNCAFRVISIIGAQQSLSSLITGSLGAGSTNTWAIPIQVTAANSLVLSTGDGIGGGELPDERAMAYPADSFDYKSPGLGAMTWRIGTTDTFEGVAVAIGPARAPSIWNSNIETRNSLDIGTNTGVSTQTNWGNHPSVFWKSSFLHTIGRMAGAQQPSLLISVSDSSTVTDVPTLSWPLTETLQENFDFGGIDSGKWSSTGSTITIGTTLDAQFATSNNYISIQSLALYNLTGSYMYSQVTDAGNQSLASWEVYPVYLIADTNNKLFVRISGNTVQPIKVVGGVTTNVGAGVAYNSTTMKYFRIRESAGTTFWDYAADPTSTWTNITSTANPITVTSITLELLVGTWNLENSTAKLDNVNTYPTQYKFSWKGLTWNQRIHAGSPSNHQGWLPANVTGPDGSGYLTFTLSNPGANYPFGGEMFSDQRGFGYGIYTTVVGTRLDTMDHRVGWGGPFTFDFTQFPAYREIDIAEVRDYNSNPNIRILHSHVWDNAGSAAFIVDDQDITNDVVQTHRLIWTPAGLTFDTYAGTGTGGTLLFHTVQSTNLPTPNLERMHFNIWSNTGVANYQYVSPFSVVLRDFVFAVLDQVSVFEASTVTESITVLITDFVNVNDASTVTDVPTVVIPTISEIINDATTVTDVPTVVLVNLVNVNDASTVTENVTVSVPTVTQNINVFDATTVTDVVVQVLKINFVNAFDSSTVTDVIVQMLMTDFINVVDTSTATDVITQILQIYNINVSDSSTVSESVTMDVPIKASVFDASTVTDVPTVVVVDLISVFDTSTITESTTVNIPVLISVFDSSTVTDVITQILKILLPNVFDTSTVTDVITQVLITDFVNVNDASTATDVPTVTQVYLINVNDTSTVTDVITQVLKIDFVNVFDASTATDVPTVVIPFYLISVFDSSTVTEALTVTSVDDESIFDVTTVTEAVTILISSTISVFDASTVTDVPTVILTNFISVNETPTAYDFRTNMMPNPSFEVNYTDGWNQFATTGTPVRTWDNTVSFFGGASYKHDANGVTTDSGLDWNFTLTPGAYRLSGYIKTQNITGDAKLVLRNRTNFNGDISLTVGNTPTSQDWQRVSGTFTVTATDSFDVVIGLGPYGAPGQGIAWFDGIILEKTSVDEAYFDGNIRGAWTGATNNSASTLSLVSIATASAAFVFDTSTVTDVPTVRITNFVSVVDTSVVWESFAGALNFNGSSQYGLFTAPTRTAGQPMSFLVWMKTSTVSLQTILGARTNPTGAGQIWKLGINTGGLASIDYDTTGAGGTISGVVSVADSRPHLLFGVYDGSNIILYVDGVQAAIITGKPNAAITTTAGAFATRTDNLGEKFSGTIGQAYVFTRSFTSTEVSNYYSTGILDLTSLAEGWLFQEGTGTTLQDFSGNGNTVTMTGTPGWTSGIDLQAGQVLEIDNVSINDASTVTDVITQVIKIDNISVNDASTVSESISLNVPVSLSVFDSTTVTDVPTVEIVYLVNVFDSSTITDTVSITVPVLISIFDSSTITESTTVLQIYTINTSDSSTVTDVVVQILKINFVNVFDSSTVTESITPNIVDFVSVNDSTTVTDASIVTLVDLVSVFDSTTVTESITLLIFEFESLFDATTVTESIVVEIIDFESLFDATTVTDVVTQIMLIDFVSVNETSSVTENVVAVVPLCEVSVGEDTTVTDVSVVVIVDDESLFDATTVTDTLVQILIISFVNVSNTSTITEAINVAPFYVLSVGDDTTVTESLTVEIIDFEELFDSSTVTDSSTVIIAYCINKFEATTITEVINANPTYVLSVSDSSIVTDLLVGQNGGIYLNPLDITIYEKVSPTPRLILVEGRLAYLVVDGPIPYYVWV